MEYGVNENCWPVGAGPSMSPGDVACWLPNVLPEQEHAEAEAGICPEGKACFKVPPGLRPPKPGDVLCWAGKDQGPRTGAKAVWEATKIGEDKIRWEGREIGNNQIRKVYTPNKGEPTVWNPVTYDEPLTYRPRKKSISRNLHKSKSNVQIEPSFVQILPVVHPYPVYPQPGPYPPQWFQNPDSSSSDSEPLYTKIKFCDCDLPLPPWIKKKKHKCKRKVDDSTPLCAITCGDPQCVVSRMAKNYKCVPITKGYTGHIKPSTISYLQNQTVFNMGDKKLKLESKNTPMHSFNIGTNKHRVQMVKPPLKNAIDPNNDSFLLNLAKKDSSGKTAKLNLSFKIPKINMPCRYDVETQFKKSDTNMPEKKKSKKGKKKKGKKKGKSKGKSRSRSRKRKKPKKK